MLAGGLTAEEIGEWVGSSGLLSLVVTHSRVLGAEERAVLAQRQAVAVNVDLQQALVDLQGDCAQCLCNWIDLAPASCASFLNALPDSLLAPSAANALELPNPLSGPHLEAAEALASVTSVLLAKAEQASPSLLSLPPSAQQALALWAKDGASDALRISALTGLKHLGKALRDPEANGAIGTVLVQAAQAASSVIVAAEAVNAMFDVYAEDDLNQAVLVPLRLLECLVAFQGPFKAGAAQWLKDHKEAARHAPEIRAQASTLKEVRANIPRFIEYKHSMGMPLPAPA